MASLKTPKRNAGAQPPKTPAAARLRTRAAPGRNVALLELLEALARAANEAATPEAAMHTCLERIADYTDSSLARVAILNADAATPAVETSMWLERAAGSFTDFMRASDQLDYSQPSGKFISVVLRDKRAVWIEDIARAFTRGRLAPAAVAGLRSAFAFPVIVGGKVAAFLEFFAKKPCKADPLLLDAVGSVGAQLARLIERARAQAVRAQLAAIVESSNDAIFSRSLDGTVLSWNAGAERMFGYTADEVIGRPISIIAPPELAHESQRNTAALLSGEPTPPFETVRVAKDGRAVQVQISVSPIRDAGGKVTAVAAIMRDVTDHKRAEAEQARLAAIVESSNDAIITRTLDGVVTSWNAGAERMLGYRAAEAIGKPATFILVPEREHVVADNNARVLSGEIIPAHETKRMTRDGQVIDVLSSHSPIRDETGAVVGASLILHDITDRKRAEAAQARLATIVETSADAIISRDLGRAIRTWNAAAERLFGWTAAEAIGRSITIIVPPERMGENARHRELIHRGEPVPAYDTQRLNKDGRRIDVSMSQSPIRDADGGVVGVSLIFRDITERREAEEQIRQLAHYDGLTGLPNRALFYDRLGQAIALARREQHAVALLYVDLDSFKAVNDTLGHNAGDELLRAVAERMQSCLRESDTIARVGGDEFIAILPRIANRQDGAAVAKKILEALSPPFFLDSARREAAIGASIGIAAFPADAEDIESLVKAADSAMYCAKQAEGRYCFYDEGPRP